ncbi:MAG: bifunctional adenosylcobinamide kinase/adenosylcobinamide-phosphate guanylyltransferase [Candidatus Brocadiales bacterium]|nr:bifunctional adenosylcobinamide kinase/adenosylcobinamide-phosphate guanylyltransferase [Candidatus Bathyanammoxibius amoris]
MTKLTLILGGVRSGKSSYAVELAKKYKNVTYVATARVEDDEMKERVTMHKKLRPASWKTVESPENLSQTVEGLDADLILIDCLTLYVSNLLLDDNEKEAKEKYITGAIEKLCGVSKDTGADVIMVSNEVGLGIVPADPLSRKFRDIAGRVNQIVASHADRVYFIAAGIPQKLK